VADESTPPDIATSTLIPTTLPRGGTFGHGKRAERGSGESPQPATIFSGSSKETTVSYVEYRKQLRGETRELRHALPDVMEGFAALYQAALADGALDTRTKELIAVGIAIAGGCDGCIASHVHAAYRAGATREELLETVGVAIMMSGGPGTIYAMQARQAIDDLDEAAA
jgi:AhpD family alkylhydroperoxidase